MSQVWALFDVDGWQHMGGWSGMMFGGWLLGLTVIALLGWLIYSASRSTDKQPGSIRALSILDEKYASGEISRDEYLEKKEDLGR